MLETSVKSWWIVGLPALFGRRDTAGYRRIKTDAGNGSLTNAKESPMARIPYFDTDRADDQLKELYAKLPPLNIFRMMGHSGPMLDKFIRLGNQILMYSKLDPILREIAIVRVGVLSGASYEVYQHERISRQLGMGDDKIEAIHEGPSAAAFTDLERLVMQFTDDIVNNVRASDATFEPLNERLSHQELQELVLTIGYYMMVSRFLETFDVDIEPEGTTEGVDLEGAKARLS